jgi:hypothetical protein
MVYVTCCYASRRPASIDLKMCNSCASLAHSRSFNKLNSLSGIDLKLVFRQTQSPPRLWRRSVFRSGLRASQPLILLASCLCPEGDLNPHTLAGRGF